MPSKNVLVYYSCTMNTILYIVLGVIFIILVYLMYIYFFTSATTLLTQTWLGKANPAQAAVSNPSSSVFTYGVWIYVNTWTQSPMNIFKCADANQTYFSIDLPYTSPTLTCSINTATTACQPSGNLVTFPITQNFGIQRWVYVLVSVNTNVVDCYIDGQLVTSHQLNAVPTISCNNPKPTWTIQYGTGDVYISNFQRWTTPTDPATAMSYYATKPTAAKTFSSYGAQLALTKDKVPQTPITLF
jgi:hypothetical protein